MSESASQNCLLVRTTAKPRLIHATNPGRAVACVMTGAPDNTQVAEEGLEVGVIFRGKTYTLAIAGDSRGIIRAEHL
jgi:hypothetical protein